MRLRSLPADIFLGSHASWFDLFRKHVEQADARSLADPFIDPEGYRAYIDDAEAHFRSVLSAQEAGR